MAPLLQGQCPVVEAGKVQEVHWEETQPCQGGSGPCQSEAQRCPVFPLYRALRNQAS